MEPRLSRPEPALWISVANSLLLMLVAFAVPGLNDNVAGLITAALVAISGAVTAWHTKPVGPSIFTGAVVAIASLAVTFGLNVTQVQVALFAAFLQNVMTIVLRNQVTPESSPMPIAGVPSR